MKPIMFSEVAQLLRELGFAVAVHLQFMGHTFLRSNYKCSLLSLGGLGGGRVGGVGGGGGCKPAHGTGQSCSFYNRAALML